MPIKMTPEAEKLHKDLTVIDGHCDTVLFAHGLDFNENKVEPLNLLERNEGKTHIDIPRLMQAGMGTQFFAMFTPDKYVSEAGKFTDDLLDTMDKIFDQSSDFVKVTNAKEIRNAKADKKLGGLVTIEGGEAIGTSLDNLHHFYDRGVRLMTLTWNRQNAIGRGAKAPGPDGITEFGKKVIGEMEEIGMIVDVSHLCDQALDEVLAIAKRPLVASHSNSRHICPHNRNLLDWQAEKIAKTGGLIAVTFAGIFVDEVPANVTLEKILDHIDRLVSVVGTAHVGLGTDFDGFSAPYGLVMPDCTGLPLLTAGLLDRGYNEADIKAIMGGNWLRVVSEIIN